MLYAEARFGGTFCQVVWWSNSPKPIIFEHPPQKTEFAASVVLFSTNLCMNGQELKKTVNG